MRTKKLPTNLEERDFHRLIFLVIIICMMSMLGCATSGGSSQPATQPKYQLLLNGTIDGAGFQGVGVGSTAIHHDMEILSPIAVDYFTVQSCHRSVQFNGVIKVPWYDWSDDNKSFTWAYDESPTIEDTGDCILRFCAFSKVVGSPPVACAIVDFKSNRYTLPGQNICNGAMCNGTPCQTSGTAICHTQVGLLERFKFSGPVVVAPQRTDPTGKSDPYWIKGQCVGKFIDAAQTLFEYQVPEDECIVVFMEKQKPFRRAKLTVIPYDLPKYQGGN